MFFVWLIKQAGFHAAVTICCVIAVALSKDAMIHAIGLMGVVFFSFVSGFLWCSEGWNRRKKLWAISDELASRWLDELCFSELWQRFAKRCETPELAERTFETVQRAMGLAIRAENNRVEWEQTHKEINETLDALKVAAMAPRKKPALEGRGQKPETTKPNL
jgi:hypothetical protein